MVAKNSILPRLFFRQVLLFFAGAGILAVREPSMAGTAFVLLALCSLPGRNNRLLLLFCALCAFAGGWAYALHRQPVPPVVPAWLQQALPAQKHGSPLPQIPVPVRAVVDAVEPVVGGRFRIILRSVEPAASLNIHDDRKLTDNSSDSMWKVVWSWNRPEAPPVLPGDVVAVPLLLSPIRSLGNFGVYDTAGYWHAQDIRFRAGVKSGAPIEVVPAAGLPERLRQQIRRNVLQALPHNGSELTQGAGLLPALLFGDRSFLSPEQSDRIARATLAHSLALSGLHLGYAVMIGSGAALLLGACFPRSWLWITRMQCTLGLGIVCSLIYLWLGQSPISLLRAFFMLLFWALLIFLRRPKVLLDGLLAAVAVLLLLDPFALFDLRLQLSALSVASIALFLPGIEPISRAAVRKMYAFAGAPESGTLSFAASCLKGACTMLLLSFAIQAALAPLLVRAFGTWGVWFPLNLLWLPVLGLVVMPFAFAGLAAAACGWSGPAALSLWIAAQPCEGLLYLLERMDSRQILLAPALWRPHWLTTLGYWMLLLVLLLWLDHRKKCRTAKNGLSYTSQDTFRPGNTEPPSRPALLSRRAYWRDCPASLLVFAALGLGCFWGPVAWSLYTQPAAGVTLRLLDVGQGQSVVLEWSLGPEKGRAVIDGGRLAATGYSAGRSVVAPALTDNAAAQADIVIASHADSDHIGGLLYILEYFQVGAYYSNGRPGAPDTQKMLEAALDRTGLQEQALYTGRQLKLAEDLYLRVLWPPPGIRPKGGNTASLVMRLDWQEKPLALLCGDIEGRFLTEAAFNPASVRSRVVVVPHHGSRKSYDRAFYQAVSPELALVSTGFANHWLFPHPEVVQGLRELGVPVYSTSDFGEIQLYWDEPDKTPAMRRYFESGVN